MKTIENQISEKEKEIEDCNFFLNHLKEKLGENKYKIENLTDLFDELQAKRYKELLEKELKELKEIKKC